MKFYLLFTSRDGLQLWEEFDNQEAAEKRAVLLKHLDARDPVIAIPA